MTIARFPVLLLLAALTVSAQSATSIHAVVTDKDGHPAPNLPSSAFTLQDNGQPAPILSACSGPTRPTKLIIVIDAINDTYTQVAYQRSQLQHFLTESSGVLPYPTSIIVAADTTLQGTPTFTTNGTALNSSLEQQTVALRDIRRDAGFDGAEERLDISLKALRRVVAYAGNTPGHKLILFISPGWPLLSGPGIQLSGKDEDRIYAQIESISSAIQSSNSTLYSVNPLGSAEDLARTNYYREFLPGVSKPQKAQIGNLGLQVLAVQSGGLSLNGNNDISKMLQQCVDDAAASYTLTFTPSPAEPGSDYHHLELRLADTKLKARTVTGLYLNSAK